MVHALKCVYYNSLDEREQMAVRSCGGPCHRKLPNCTHLCPEICHPGQCPSPDKCSKKVTVRCGCQTLKKEWPCQDVQEAYRNAGSNPKDVPKSHFGFGLLPCGPDCRNKMKITDSELQLRKSAVTEKKEPDGEKPVAKRRRRRERIQEDKKVSTLQIISGATRKVLLIVIILATLIAVAYCGYNGLLWVSDRMNEAEIQRQRRRYPRIWLLCTVGLPEHTLADVWESWILSIYSFFVFLLSHMKNLVNHIDRVLSFLPVKKKIDCCRHGSS